MSKETLEVFWKVIIYNDLKKNGDDDAMESIEEYDIRPVSEKSCVVIGSHTLVYFQENGVIVNSLDGRNIS